MPTVLRVQGVELDVAAADWEPVRLGQVARSFSGAARSSVRKTKRDHRFKGDPGGVTVPVAEVLRAFIEGDGHSWNFEDDSAFLSILNSSRGLAPYTSGVADPDVGRYGGGAQFNNGEADTKWALGYDNSACTLMYWVNTGSGWEHLLILPGSGVVFSGTTQTDLDPGFIEVDSIGDLVVHAESLGTFKVDDLVVLPYEIPGAWVAEFVAFRADQQWAPLPYVTADGEAFSWRATQCLGQVGTAARVPLRTAGTFGLGEVLEFTLMER